MQKIAPQAESGKYFQIWFFSLIFFFFFFGGGGGEWRRSKHAHIGGGKKGEIRDWTTQQINISAVTTD